MRKRILNVLKGKFLVSEDAVKNWRFILFASFLAVVMIASSHSADRKVHEIARLNEEVRELRSEYVDIRSQSQQLRLESNVIEAVKSKGLVPSEDPPKKIKVAEKE